MRLFSCIFPKYHLSYHPLANISLLFRFVTIHQLGITASYLSCTSFVLFIFYFVFFCPTDSVYSHIFDLTIIFLPFNTLSHLFFENLIQIPHLTATKVRHADHIFKVKLCKHQKSPPLQVVLFVVQPCRLLSYCLSNDRIVKVRDLLGQVSNPKKQLTWEQQVFTKTVE